MLLFHYWKRHSCCVQQLCRVLKIGHTAKALFAVCCQRGTRQSCYTRQKPFLPCASSGTRQIKTFAVCFLCVAVCIVFSTRQSFSKKVDFILPIFFGIHVLYMVLYANIWYFFSLFSTFSHLISLNTFVGIKSNLNCKQFE